MIKILDCRNSNYLSRLKLILNKRRFKSKINTDIVIKIVKDIKKNKQKALLKYEKKFSKNTKIKPKKNEINKSIKSLDPKIKNAIDFAYSRILKFHSLQKNKNIKYVDKQNNKIGYRYIPIQSVGIYVPSNLPSTLLMNAILAKKIAGVKRVVLANPRLNGKLNPAVMYAAKKCGISEIISAGGSQAIASLAYIQKVNKIVGPGNDYVARAKKEVFNDVGIDMIAGPSEITVVADKFSNINWVVADLIAQAEHDINSQCILVSKEKKIINDVKLLIYRQLKHLPRRNIATKSLKLNGIFIKAYSNKQISDIINIIAPEHLELSIKNYNNILRKIKNAGSICLGNYSAMAVTDYNAGTNHILPTNSSAKFSSGLSVNDFYKRISYINLSKKGIETLGPSAITLAKFEGLEGHAKSIKLRLGRK